LQPQSWSDFEYGFSPRPDVSGQDLELNGLGLDVWNVFVTLPLKSQKKIPGIVLSTFKSEYGIYETIENISMNYKKKYVHSLINAIYILYKEQRTNAEMKERKQLEEQGFTEEEIDEEVQKAAKRNNKAGRKYRLRF